MIGTVPHNVLLRSPSAACCLARSQTQIILGGGWNAGLCQLSHTMNAATEHESAMQFWVIWLLHRPTPVHTFTQLLLLTLFF